MNATLMKYIPTIMTFLAKLAEWWASRSNKKPPTGPITRDRPVGIWIAGLLATSLVASGCATFKAENLDELAKLCEQFAPCKPCPEPTPQPDIPWNDPPINTSLDGIDPATISWGEPLSPAKWPITHKLRTAKIEKNGNGYRIAISPSPATWPIIMREGWKKPAIGNWWIIGKKDGEWAASTVEWLGSGAMQCTFGPERLNELHGKLNGFQPQSGDLVGVMLSTIARSPQWKGPTDERTQIMVTKWP